MYPIDVHVIHTPHDRSEWVDACLALLAGEPVNIHHVDWVEGDIRQARWNGFQRGTAEYVSFVDLDDLIVPGCFDAALSAIASTAGVAAYTLCDRMGQNGESLGLIHEYRPWAPVYRSKCLQEVHQLCVMKRCHVADVFNSMWDVMPVINYSELFLYAALRRYGPLVPVDFIGYRWRLHDLNSHKLDAYGMLERKRIADIINTMGEMYK